MDEKAPEKHSWFCHGPGIWGRGKTKSEAIKNARDVFPMRQNEFLLYLVPEGAYMDNGGFLHYVPHGEGCPHCQKDEDGFWVNHNPKFKRIKKR